MQLPTIRIFVSSPGDVELERSSAERVILRLRDRLASYAVIEPVLWEHEPMRASSNFQSQVPLASECDIVLLLLWARIGTRLPQSMGQDARGQQFESGTAYEFETSFESYRTQGHPDILIYRKTAQYVPHGDAPEILEEAANQRRRLDDFLHRLYDEEGLPQNAYRTFAQTREFEQLVEIHLEKLIERRLLPAATTPTWQGNPFRGLEPFELEHAPVFFGRQTDTERVFRRLSDRHAENLPFVVISGPSGSGKSSLARCGLLSRVLGDRPNLPHAIIRPSDASTPLDAFADGLINAVPSLAPFDLHKVLRQNPSAFGPILNGVMQPQDGSDDIASQYAFLVIIDQLEEAISASEHDRMEFATAVDAVANSSSGWMLATLRSDRYASLAELPEFDRLMDNGGLYSLRPPTKAEIGQVIRRPARAGGLHFEENRQTGETLDDLIREDAGENPESLPLLEFTLAELYQKRNESGLLTFEAYQSFGGLEGAIARKASEVYSNLEPAVKASSSRVFRQLVTVAVEDGSASRNRCGLSQFADDPEGRDFVLQFVDARLMIQDELQGKPTVEIVHESLLSTWPPIVEWLQSESALLQKRSRTIEDYARWKQAGKPNDLLLPGGILLDEGRQVVSEYGLLPNDIREEVTQYVERSDAANRFRRRIAIGGVVALAAAAVGFALLGWQASVSRDRAESASQVAKQEEERANQLFALARQTPDRYLEALSEDPRMISEGSYSFRRTMLEDATQLYEKLVTFVGEDEDPELRFARGQALLRLGIIMAESGTMEEAIELQEASKTVLTQLVKEQPDEARFASELGRIQRNLGYLYMQTDQDALSEQAHTAAVKIFEDLSAESAAPFVYELEAAINYTYIAECYYFHFEQKDLEKANDAFGKADDLFVSLSERVDAGDFPKELVPKLQYYYGMNLFDMGISVGQAELDSLADGNTGEAERCKRLARKHYLKAREVYEELVDNHPNVAKYRNRLARSKSNYGVWNLNTRGDTRTAAELFEQAADINADLTFQHPDVIQFWSDLLSNHRTLRAAYSREGNAGGLRNATIRLVQVQLNMLRHARSFARIGLHELANGIVDVAISRDKINTGGRVELEAARALAWAFKTANATSEESLRESYANRSVELLRTTLESDDLFTDPSDLLEDPDLQSLTSHEPFMKLLEEAEKSVSSDTAGADN